MGREPKPYLIFVTAKARTQDIVTGLGAGADDYIVKPFEREELHARVQVGFRMLELQAALAERVRELEDALTRVKQLQGLLPICSYCKKVRDDQNYWQQVETYIEGHSDAQFTPRHLSRLPAEVRRARARPAAQDPRGSRPRAVIALRRAEARGHFDFGWLDTFHTFSFGEYYDPSQMGFRALRVLNEDRVQPGRGFPTHGHRNMEIVSYVLEGRSSTGTARQRLGHPSG